MLSCTVKCVFLYLVPVQSARYDSPNNLSLLPADTQHNTKPTLIFCLTVAQYPVTLTLLYAKDEAIHCEEYTSLYNGIHVFKTSNNFL